MTPPIAIVLILLVVALILFSTERIPIDIVTILLVVALILTGTLDVREAFAGFGNDIVITIAGLFVLTGGLVKTGVVDLVGRRLHRIAGGNEFRLATLVMFTAAACASVMKNTTTTAMFVPVVLGMAARARPAVEAPDAARLRRDPRRHLYADRHLDEPRRLRCTRTPRQ